MQEDLALALVLRLFSTDGLGGPCVHRCDRGATLGQRARLPRPLRALPRDDRADHRLPAGPRPDAGAPHLRPRASCPKARASALDVYVDEDGGDPLAWAFGALGLQDRARHLATLYLNDLADVLRDAVDPRFEFVRYAESLAQSQPTFDPLADALAAPPNLVDRTLHELTLQAVDAAAPTLVLVSVPFPGAVYAAFRIAQAIKAQHPHDRHRARRRLSSTPSCAS